jgi:hypothetical protein
LLDTEARKTFADCIVRADRANKPNFKTMPQVVDMIQEVTGLERKQVRDAYARIVKPTHEKVLTGIVKAQKTTTARSAMTVEGEWRWHSSSLIDSMWDEIVNLNKQEGGSGSEVPRSWRNDFVRVMKHFCGNGDEGSLLASSGDVHVVGEKALRAGRNTRSTWTTRASRSVSSVVALPVARMGPLQCSWRV